MGRARVLLFPFPLRGHIQPFLCLAELLSDAGLDVVFLTTEYHHRRIANLDALTARFPSLHFATISDGLPPDRPRDNLDGAVYSFLRDEMKPLLRRLVQSFNDDSCAESRPINCFITDMVVSAPVELAEELGILAISFCPCSARYLSMQFWIPKLVEEGQIPYADDNPLGEIYGSPLFEGLLRRKDLPGFWNAKTSPDKSVSISINKQIIAACRSSALVLNTYDELESPFLTYLSSIFNKIYTIGPVHTLSKSRLGDSSSSSSLGGFWKEDETCMSWLDSQPSKSVIFVSFGSTVRMKADELVEFWHGLLNSGKSFLIVLRSDAVHGGKVGELMKQLVEERGKTVNGITVEWAPQEKVLNHRAVGGFLTHCGWNSTVETIAAGVPMICWPVLGDQSSNARWIDRVWKIGNEIDHKWDRSTVEKMIRELMDDQNGEIQKSIQKLSNLANERAAEGGLSSRNFENLVEYIKSLKPNN